MSYFLSFDEGTTSARTVIYDEQLVRLGMHAFPIESKHPHPGWVEQDAELIWQAQIDSARTVLEHQKLAGKEVRALGITNQRETIVVWERATGRPVNPAIVWQCRRTADYCKGLVQEGWSKKIQDKTGLVVDAYFSASKARWILENVKDAKQKAADGELLLGTIDTWLIWKLTNGRVHATEPSNASRTMLWNIFDSAWDQELCELFGIPASMLPEVRPSSGDFGVTEGEWLDAEIPIAGVAGDQQSALFGQGCVRPGLSKNTYGTGCFALMHTGSEGKLSQNRMITTRAAAATPEYALEGSVFVAGAAVQWLRDKLQIIGDSVETEALAKSVTSTEGVYLVPAFVGLGAPYWDGNARGLISGMTLGTTKAHIVRAALESMAFQTRELLDAMGADSGLKVAELRVDGGATRNNFLMQFQADILGCRLVRPLDTETTARGAAALAALGIGFHKSMDESAASWQAERVFEPQMGEDERQELFSGWKQAVQRALGN